MLTKKQTMNTAKELQENYKRLNYSEERVLKDTRLKHSDLQNILSMSNPNPSDVWMLRDYLEDMMKKENKELYPFSRLANHSSNHWYTYDTPWRK